MKALSRAQRSESPAYRSGDQAAGIKRAFQFVRQPLRLHFIKLSQKEDRDQDDVKKVHRKCRQHFLKAARHVIASDGTVTVAEGELYRAFAATLDCPMPALGQAA